MIKDPGEVIVGVKFNDEPVYWVLPTDHKYVGLMISPSWSSHVESHNSSVLVVTPVEGVMIVPVMVGARFSMEMVIS